MLQRTQGQAHQENQETGVRRIIRTFNPEVPGYVFWPIIFGTAAILAVLGVFVLASPSTVPALTASPSRTLTRCTTPSTSG